jgi:hypothetical protein
LLRAAFAAQTFLDHFSLLSGMNLFDVEGNDLPFVFDDCIHIQSTPDPKWQFETEEFCRSQPIRTALKPLELMVRRGLTYALAMQQYANQAENKNDKNRRIEFERRSELALLSLQHSFCQWFDYDGLLSLRWTHRISADHFPSNARLNVTLVAEYDCREGSMIDKKWQVFF